MNDNKYKGFIEFLELQDYFTLDFKIEYINLPLLPLNNDELSITRLSHNRISFKNIKPDIKVYKQYHSNPIKSEEEFINVKNKHWIEYKNKLGVHTYNDYIEYTNLKLNRIISTIEKSYEGKEDALSFYENNEIYRTCKCYIDYLKNKRKIKNDPSRRSQAICLILAYFNGEIDRDLFFSMNHLIDKAHKLFAIGKGQAARIYRDEVMIETKNSLRYVEQIENKRIEVLNSIEKKHFNHYKSGLELYRKYFNAQNIK
jgi:hypothetical protein